jgi:quaternary ammonium compound-resistance protein SugE
VPWLYLTIAGLFEVAWAISLAYTQGWTKLWPSVATVLLMLVSFYCLAQAVKEIPVGTGYAIWTGIGAVGTAALGVLIFKEPVSALRIGCILLIVLGIVGLKVTSSH